jgi:hypothetical protein
MASVAVQLYANPAHNRFITSPTNAAAPAPPTATAGDTWNLELYFLDDGVGGGPFVYHRYATPISALRFRAAGNSHIYAYGDNNTAPVSEIGPANENVSVTRTQGGLRAQEGGPREEIQRVILPAVPVGGSYQLNFPGPTVVGAPSGIAAPKGTVTVLAGWTLTQIRDAIRALPFYCVFNATLTPAPGYEQYLTLTGSIGNYFIHYQSSPGDRPGPIEMVTLSANSLNYQYGWAFNVPLTAADFADLYIPANGPAYIEALIDGAVVAQFQLTAGGVGNTPPAFTNGPPPPTAQLSVPFNFGYSATGFPLPTFALTSGALPVGLSLSSAGAITGVPGAPGTYSGVVTATNAAGSATQAFSISVGVPPPTGGGGSSPPPVHDLAPTYNDGNYDNLLEIDEPIPEYREDHPGLVIWHRFYEVRHGSYQNPAIGALLDSYGYFIRDTNFRNTGDQVWQFERLTHNIPGVQTRKVSATKNIQACLYSATGGQVKDLSILSYNSAVDAIETRTYALDDPGSLPELAMVQLLSFPNIGLTLISDLGTGFPKTNFGNLPGFPNEFLFDNNRAACFIPSGSGKEHIIGRLYCRKVLIG